MTACTARLLELWQTEWCPASKRVRQRLTELGLEFVARPVPVDKAERRELLNVTGQTSIPVLVDGDRVVAGEAAILEYLGAFPEPPEAALHRAKALKARRRELEDACREASGSAGEFQLSGRRASPTPAKT
jgi:glutaredoxin 3